MRPPHVSFDAHPKPPWAIRVCSCCTLLCGAAGSLSGRSNAWVRLGSAPLRPPRLAWVSALDDSAYMQRCAPQRQPGRECGTGPWARAVAPTRRRSVPQK